MTRSPAPDRHAPLRAPGALSVVVTGAAGFVGANLIRALALRGHRVVAFDHRPPGEIARFLRELRHRLRDRAVRPLDPLGAGSPAACRGPMKEPA